MRKMPFFMMLTKRDGGRRLVNMNRVDYIDDNDSGGSRIAMMNSNWNFEVREDQTTIADDMRKARDVEEIRMGRVADRMREPS